MRRLRVLCALMGLLIGCRGVLGIEPPPPQTSDGPSPSKPQPSAGNIGQMSHATQMADAGRAGEGGSGGMHTRDFVQGGAGGASTGHATVERPSDEEPIEVPVAGRGGRDASDAGQGGGAAGEPSEPSGGGAGAPSMASASGGGGGAGGADARSPMAGSGGMAAPADPCKSQMCPPPPAASCSGQTFTRFETASSCPDGCTYTKNATNCQFGCTSSGCKSDPCAGVTCATPPKATCANATTLRQYASTGTCGSGTCDYASSDTSCPSQSPKCNGGACVACVSDQDCSTGDQCSSSHACVKAQFLLIDETYTATAADIDDKDRYNTTPRYGIPADWTKPVNFIDGRVFVELEILEKPSDVATLYNICFANSIIDACMPYAPTFTKPGRYDFNATFERFWQNDVMDWSKGVTKIQIYLKNDKEDKRPGSDTNFYPMKAHVTVTVVAPGATYIPPVH